MICVMCYDNFNFRSLFQESHSKKVTSLVLHAFIC